MSGYRNRLIGLRKSRLRWLREIVEVERGRKGRGAVVRLGVVEEMLGMVFWRWLREMDSVSCRGWNWWRLWRVALRGLIGLRMKIVKVQKEGRWELQERVWESPRVSHGGSMDYVERGLRRLGSGVYWVKARQERWGLGLTDAEWVWMMGEAGRQWRELDRRLLERMEEMRVRAREGWGGGVRKGVVWEREWEEVWGGKSGGCRRRGVFMPIFMEIRVVTSINDAIPMTYVASETEEDLDPPP